MGGRRAHLTAEHEDEIARRYSAGDGIVLLAREYGVRTERINAIIAAHDAKREPATCSICGASPVVGRGWCRTHYNNWHKHDDPLYIAPPREPRSRFSPEEQREITETYLSAGEDRSRIIAILTERFQCSKPTIYRIVRRNGGETFHRKRARHDPPPLLPTKCTADGCEVRLRTNAMVTGLCRKHRDEALQAAAPECSEKGCERRAQIGRSHEMCTMHARRYRVRGDAGGVEPERVRSYDGALCKHPSKECPRPAQIKGWCELHWGRVERTGDPGVVGNTKQRIVVIDGVEHRPCYTCGVPKLLTEFYQSKVTGYYDNDCKRCARKRALAHRHANLERSRENSRRYYHENPDLVNTRTIMRRDIERSGQAEGDEIDRREVAEMFGWICQLCSEPIDPSINHRKWDCKPMGVSLDHIVPLTRGGLHVWSNVQPAHLVCNERKQNRMAGDDDVCVGPG